MLHKKNFNLLALMLLLTLTACGGGSGGGDEVTQDNTTDEEASTPDETTAPDDSDTTTPDENSEPPTDDDTPPASDNQSPTATISGVQSATSGETLILDGSASNDPDEDTLSYLWSQLSGEPVSLVNNTSPTFSFIAPDVAETTTLRFQLTVSDGQYTAAASIDIQLSPMADTTAPSITARSPLPDATGVATNTTISVHFNEALQADLIDSQSLQVTQAGSPVSGSISYDTASDSLTLTFDAPLQAETRYTVTLGNHLQDPSGNPVASETWDFTTGSSYNLGATPQTTIDECMNDSDKLMLTLVNNARASARLCGDSEYPAVDPIAWHCQLESAAQGHSTSMAENDFFDHTGLDGLSPGDRISAAGYTWRSYAENIAAGYADEATAMSAWLESPGHCVNIMSSRITEMGAAVAENPEARYRIYWTQDFADQ
jgi:uncharacterized protein YkwD